ncbi:sensor histidine kinase [Ornithinibacillus scapharcae]|uniref:sensor histidine kinase n=1 Tax=Ornithinibacillus scapharcae TaxID=1147159 RepID=UPI000225BBCA|nr:sensor histidine kinase [Ornithinibacillus scapharcae]
MKLFLKEHAFLLVVHIVQLIFLLLIYWLDGYRDLKLFFYAGFIILFFLVGYLFYHWIKHREFYRRLESPLDSLDDTFQVADQAPIAVALDNLLREQYKLYQHRLSEKEKQQEEHRKFMDQWVHQMKTPLSVIELTAQGLDEPDSSSIREETDRIKNGLNTVLYMARLRTIEQDFHIKPVNLSSIIHEVNKENKRFYIRNQVYPKLEESREAITVETDEKWMFFILSQLLNNAVKYSAGRSNRVLISLYDRQKEAILEVTDYGIGIPDTDQRRIFDPFYTGENGRKYRESTGMGLYLVKEIIDYLGHQIEVGTEVNSGTTVRIIFSDTQNLTAL